MVRILIATLLAVSAGSALAQESKVPARYSYVMGTDVSFVHTSGHPSWVNGSAGKLRYDSTSDGVTISHIFTDYQLRIADTLKARVVANMYNDDIDSGIDLTEAYLEWRPLTLSRNRYRLKVGGFYPRLSFENTGPAWTSPYTISSSAINTWIGEEIRTMGAEFTYSRRLEAFGGGHTFSAYASIFGNNEPAGGLIAWKGWSLHDRQTRFNDVLPLPPLPQIQPDGVLRRQDPFFIPFMKVDGTKGNYVGLEWEKRGHFLVRAMVYDNHADPAALRNGQYAWYTEFNSLGLQASLPGDVGLIAQWMSGETIMGPDLGRFRGPEFDGVYPVDNAYESSFVLLTRAFDRHRLSVRYDDFEITEADLTPLDENAEKGHAWTLAYKFQVNDNFGVVAEWLQIDTVRPAWAYNNLATSRSESQFQLSMQLRISNH
jgi:hypothetical protein